MEVTKSACIQHPCLHKERIKGAQSNFFRSQVSICERKMLRALLKYDFSIKPVHYKNCLNFLRVRFFFGEAQNVQ